MSDRECLVVLLECGHYVPCPHGRADSGRAGVDLNVNLFEIGEIDEHALITQAGTPDVVTAGTHADAHSGARCKT